MKTTIYAAAIALSANTAFAGGLSPVIVEAPAMEQELVAANPSINPAYIVVGIVAALLIVSTVGNDSSDEPDSTGSTDDCAISQDNYAVSLCP
ncbi:hypothetical protein [Yoonia sp.]|uniref:hypothetical protein n=1 Tax=Yoonia sp. TaxID=2212373 RepID=UPI003975CA93